MTLRSPGAWCRCGWPQLDESLAPGAQASSPGSSHVRGLGTGMSDTRGCPHSENLLLTESTYPGPRALGEPMRSGSGSGYSRNYAGLQCSKKRESDCRQLLVPDRAPTGRAQSACSAVCSVVPQDTLRGTIQTSFTHAAALRRAHASTSWTRCFVAPEATLQCIHKTRSRPSGRTHNCG